MALTDIWAKDMRLWIGTHLWYPRSVMQLKTLDCNCHFRQAFITVYFLFLRIPSTAWRHWALHLTYRMALGSARGFRAPRMSHHIPDDSHLRNRCKKAASWDTMLPIGSVTSGYDRSRAITGSLAPDAFIGLIMKIKKGKNVGMIRWNLQSIFYFS